MTALGLALLLVVGAWSNAHGQTDAHTTLCLTPGSASPAAGTTSSDGETAVVDVLVTGAALCSFAALCGIALLRLRRRIGPPRGIRLRRRTPTTLPVRAGPVAFPFPLTLIQLSVSRT